jgi:hypothetical protein
MARKLAIAAACFGLLAAVGAPSLHAGSLARPSMTITFNQPVHLPGVSLGTGTYLFEVPDPMGAWDVVRVASQDGRFTYFMGFTRRIRRPARLDKNAAISLGESAAGVAAPITAWYPDGDTGHEFVYPR